MITYERLREVMDYDKDTGVFTWKQRVANRVRIGDVAGTVMNTGYVRIRVDGHYYLAHVLAWLFVEMALPTENIDHRNKIKHDNRWINLRQSTSGNMCNRGVQAHNLIGCKNISVRNGGRFLVRVSKDGKTYHGGYFSTLAEAENAAATMREKLHGEFASHV